MMKGIEAHTVDPFLLNVDEIIRIVQEYFPEWDQPEELNLDAEAIHHLASVIKLQSEWVKQRSTSLYTDPFLLGGKDHPEKQAGNDRDFPAGVASDCRARANYTAKLRRCTAVLGRIGSSKGKMGATTHLRSCIGNG